MQGRQVFGALVRFGALVVFYYSFVNAVYAVAATVPTPLMVKYTFGDAALWAVIQFALASLVFMNAERIVLLAYGPKPADPKVV